NELQTKIAEALKELPEGCRTIFQMSRFEALKYREIAEKLDISVKTVENQMGKALKIMRLKLSDYLMLLLVLSIIHHLLEYFTKMKTLKNNKEFIDELLVKFLVGEANAKEKKCINDWTAESSENAQYFYDFKKIWENSKVKNIETPLEDDAWN